QFRRSSPGPALAGWTLLVIDDHEDTRIILSQLLEAAGARVTHACDGYEGLDQLAHGPPPDLILCDPLMPGMDGLEFARPLHADPRWARIPIIAVTALGAPAHYIRTWAHGLQGHIVKPVDGDQLIEFIRRFRPGPAGAGPAQKPRPPLAPS